MIVTSLFLLSLMCSYMPCDPKYSDPKIREMESQKRLRFSRSGPSKPNFADLVEGQDPVVQTKTGTLEGYMMKIINGRKIYAFEGIPYAEPPVGHLRFRNPVPKYPWAGVRQAKQTGPLCLQYHVRKLIRITGSEDCLTLNIYTPGLPADLKGKIFNPAYPTIIWIHGGGFFFGGGGEWGPSYVLQEDLILVTLQYRLGVLGFLSTADNESPGNYGLKDQAMAIRWISENIQAFGGDPGKITLMGQSTGAASVHLHMMSPLTKHLFQAGVSSSGTAINHWAVNREARSLRLTRKLAESVGCPTTAGSRSLMDCFRSTNPYFLLHEQQRLYDFMTFPPILFAPVVELPSPGAFLTETPETLYATNMVAPIPWICSQTTEEGEAFAMAFKHVGRIPFYEKMFEKFSPIILDYWYIARNASEITQRIRDMYFGENGPTPTESSIRIISDLVSDRYFRVGIHRAITLHSRIAPTFASLFGFRSPLGLPSVGGENPYNSNGVGHASDVGFYFNSSLYFPPLEMGTPTYDMSRMLINFVMNFAKKKEPFFSYQNGNVVKMWRPATFDGKDVRMLLMDNENVVMIPEPRLNAIRFWESLGLPDTPKTIYDSVKESQSHHNQGVIRPTFQTPRLPVIQGTPEALTMQQIPGPFGENSNHDHYKVSYSTTTTGGGGGGGSHYNNGFKNSYSTSGGGGNNNDYKNSYSTTGAGGKSHDLKNNYSPSGGGGSNNNDVKVSYSTSGGGNNNNNNQNNNDVVTEYSMYANSYRHKYKK